MGLDHHLFLPWFEGLGDEPRVVLFDFSGHGGSRREMPADELSHEVWVRDIEALREHLGLDRIAVLGHSHGGLLAQEYALAHPDRVSHLVLASTVPVLDYAGEIIENARARGTPEQAELAARVLGGAVRTDTELRDAFGRLLPLYFHRWDEAKATALLDGLSYRADAFIAGNERGLPGFDTRARLPELDVPTLVISGADDWIMPLEHGGRRLAAAIPGARLVELESSGHFPYVEESEAFFEAVTTFLRETGA